MKKIICVLAACAVLGGLWFAERASGKGKGISITDDSATITIELGNIDPFVEGGFSYTGEKVTETVPFDIPVEIAAPGRKQEKQSPKMNIKQIGLDDFVNIVYEENDSSKVAKIQTLPKMNFKNNNDGPARMNDEKKMPKKGNNNKR